jgi:hypothetical protein
MGMNADSNAQVVAELPARHIYRQTWLDRI